MTAREARLERRLCERERELIEAELALAWHRERWRIVAGQFPGEARMAEILLACKRAGARRAAA